MLLILDRCEARDWDLAGSESIAYELANLPDEERRQRVVSLASLANTHIEISPVVETRAIELEAMGFGALGAPHVACAEAAGAMVLLTTDDVFHRRATRWGTMLKVRVANPTGWLMEACGDADAEADSD